VSTMGKVLLIICAAAIDRGRTTEGEVFGSGIVFTLKGS
jgi:hypothetical protein